MNLYTVLSIKQHLRNDDTRLTPAILGFGTPVRSQTQSHSDGSQCDEDCGDDDGSTAVIQEGCEHVLHCGEKSVEPASQKKRELSKEDRRSGGWDTRVYRRA